MSDYFFIAIPVITFCLTAFMISKDLIKRAGREDEVILKSGLIINSNLVFGVLMLILSIIIIRIGLKSLLDFY